jgi:phage-related protein
MSVLTYLLRSKPGDRPLVWLQSEIKTPPIGLGARLEAGYLLRRVQRGELLGMPQSRPMPALGARFHELRVRDRRSGWRIFYRVDPDAILILDVVQKQTRATPHEVLDRCRRRAARYDEDSGEQPEREEAR